VCARGLRLCWKVEKHGLTLWLAFDAVGDCCAAVRPPCGRLLPVLARTSCPAYGTCFGGSCANKCCWRTRHNGAEHAASDSACPLQDTPAGRSFAAPEGDASHVPARALAAKESSAVLVGGRDSPQAPAHAPSAETPAAAEDHSAENGAAPKDTVTMDTDQQGGEQPAAAAEEASASPAATEKDTEMGEPAATNGDEAVEETAVATEAPGKPAQAEAEAEAAAPRAETPASTEAARTEEPDLTQNDEDEGKASAAAEAEPAPVPAAEAEAGAGAGADRPASRKASANSMLGDAADGLDLSDESPAGTPGAAEAHGTHSTRAGLARCGCWLDLTITAFHMALSRDLWMCAIVRCALSKQSP
jgi:hypothetical protein